MGVSGFYQFLRRQRYQPDELYDLKGLRIGVDTRALLYRYAYDLDFEGLETNLLDRLDRFFHTLMLFGTRELFLVFDGGTVPQEKTRIMEQRQQLRDRARSRLDGMKRSLKITEAPKKRKHGELVAETIDAGLYDKLRRVESSARGMPKETYQAIIEGLQSKGYRCFVAESEADFALNYLSENGHIDVIMSDDADLLMCPGTRLLRQVPQFVKGDGTLPVIYDHSNICRCLQLDSSQLQDLVCLMGCDYTPGVRGIGPVSALSAIKKHRDISNFIASWSEKQCRRYSFYGTGGHVQFLEEVRRCKKLFVWRPDTERLKKFLLENNASPSPSEKEADTEEDQKESFGTKEDQNELFCTRKDPTDSSCVEEAEKKKSCVNPKSLSLPLDPRGTSVNVNAEQAVEIYSRGGTTNALIVEVSKDR